MVGIFRYPRVWAILSSALAALIALCFIVLFIWMIVLMIKFLRRAIKALDIYIYENSQNHKEKMHIAQQVQAKESTVQAEDIPTESQKSEVVKESEE